MQTHWRLAKNAVANLTRGGAAGMVALFLPAVLVRHMSQIEYSVWVLVLQVAAYAGYLEFGLQTAIGRYLAIAQERRDDSQRDSIFSTAFAGLCIAAAIALVLLIATALAAGHIFPNIPRALLPQMRRGLLIVGGSIALGLPASAWSGVFVGMQRNEFIALANGGSRVVSALGLAVASVHGWSLTAMAMIVAIVNYASYLLLYLFARRVSPTVFRPKLVSKLAARELFGYCSGLMVWSFSMMLVSGLDLILVGRFELKALAPYAIASTLVLFVGGLQTAVFSAMMPHAAVLHARNDAAGLGRMVVSSTQLGVLLLLFSGLPLLIYATPLLRLWVGTRYATQGYSLLAILLIANMIRLSGTPYATVLVAAGQQRLVTVSPVMEGVANLVCSVLLGLKFGAVGVALGTLIGAIVSMLGHTCYNLPRTRSEIAVRIREFVFSGLALPLIATGPLTAIALWFWKAPPPGAPLFALVFATSFLFSGALLFHAQTSAGKSWTARSLATLFTR